MVQRVSCARKAPSCRLVSPAFLQTAGAREQRPLRVRVSGLFAHRASLVNVPCPLPAADTWQSLVAAAHPPADSPRQCCRRALGHMAQTAVCRIVRPLRLLAFLGAQLQGLLALLSLVSSEISCFCLVLSELPVASFCTSWFFNRVTVFLLTCKLPYKFGFRSSGCMFIF